MSTVICKCIPAFVIFSVSTWAADLQLPGLPHFFQVNEHLYRGAQPTVEGWANLSKLGVKTVIDLRREGEEGHSIAGEASAVQAAGMRYVNIPMQGIVAPGEEQIARAMALMNSADPVFVHCKKGMDRTGTVIACYRIGHDGWTNQKAMVEAKSLGLHWLEVGMKQYIQSYRGAPATLAAAPAAVN